MPRNRQRGRGRKDKIKRNIGKGRNQDRSGFLTKPRTPRQARREAKGAARAEYGPTIRAAGQEMAGSRARQKQAGEWFNQLGAQAQQAAAQTDQSYSAANAAMQANIAAAQQAAAKTQGTVGAGNADFAKLTGADPSTFAPTMKEADFAAQQRALTGSMLAAPIAQAGASQAGFLRSTGLTARREGISQRQAESRRRDKIKQDLAALRKERAGKVRANLGEIRQQERDYSIQRKAFSLDRQGQRQAGRQAAADRRFDARQGALNRGQDERASIRSNKPEPEGKSGMTPTQERNARREQKSANITARNLYQAAKKPPQTAAEWAAFTQLIASEDGIDAAAAKKAVNRLRKKLRNRQSGPRPEDIPR